MKRMITGWTAVFLIAILSLASCTPTDGRTGRP